jgi:putative ABC transport system permease protein
MTLYEAVLRDCRHGVRLLVKTPGFTVAAVTMLALGIGANTAIFSVIRAVLVEPLPYGAPDRLVVIWNPADARATTHLSLREILTYGDEVASFDRVAGYTEANANLTGAEDPERVRAGFVTINCFQTLDVPPLLGRTFTPDEGRPGAPAVVMLAERLWLRRYGGAPDVVGRSIRVNGRERTVVGVMPASFRLPLDYRAARPTEVWLPLTVDRANPGAWGDRSYFAIGRLKAGVSPSAATSEVAVITDRWVGQGLEGFRGGVIRRHALPVQDLVTGTARTPLLVLLGAVAAVLLIACANVVNLMFARADARRREVAIRAALGAARGQVIRLFVTEAAVLSLIGALGGIALAQLALRLLVALEPAGIPRVEEVALDPGVLAATAVLSMLSALLFGLAPALQLVGSGLTTFLSDSGRHGTAGRRSQMVRRTLVVVQLAFSVVLVVGAGLLVRTLTELRRIDLGFDPRNILTAQLQLPLADYQDDDAIRFYRELTTTIRQLPGVIDAGAVRVIPLARSIGDYSITIDGRPTRPGENPNGDFQWVTPGYFAAMGVALSSGRLLTDHDGPDAPLAVVINETMAARYWPGEDAVGKRFHMGGNTAMPPMTIVGIVRPTHHNRVVESPRAEMYLPHAQLARSVGGAARSMALVVKTAGDPLPMVDAVRAVVRQIDRNLPLADVRTMEEITAAALATPRFAALLLAVFATLALALATIGVYATISLLVAERAQEIGIRIALGAARRRVVGLVLREGLILTIAGLSAGLFGAIVLSRSLETLLYGVGRYDAATFATVSIVLVIAALAACFNPARRATAVDPALALRQG